jgi:hypothetical protein
MFEQNYSFAESGYQTETVESEKEIRGKPIRSESRTYGRAEYANLGEQKADNNLWRKSFAIERRKKVAYATEGFIAIFVFIVSLFMLRLDLLASIPDLPFFILQFVGSIIAYSFFDNRGIKMIQCGYSNFKRFKEIEDAKANHICGIDHENVGEVAESPSGNAKSHFSMVFVLISLFLCIIVSDAQISGVNIGGMMILGILLAFVKSYALIFRYVTHNLHIFWKAGSQWRNKKLRIVFYHGRRAYYYWNRFMKNSQ